MSYPKDGVVAFSVTQGMPLTGIYDYTPNPNGPVVTPKNGYFDISRGSASAANQWTNFGINVAKPVATGLIHQFNIACSKIDPATEVKLTLAADVILRYDGTSFNYFYYTTSFQLLGPSAIKVDGKTHQINLVFSPSAVVIFEDGNFVAQWKKTIAASIQPLFAWQILAANTSLSATLSSILVIPSVFASTVQTPWDLALTSKWSLPSDIWTVTPQSGNPIPVTYAPDYLRAATSSLSIANSAVNISVTFRPVQAVGIVQYRMRVNASGGNESKITVIGDNILRITANGSSVLWTRYISGGPFEQFAVSTIKVGSGNFTDVTVVYSPAAISLFEDGVLLYTRTYSPAQQYVATWNVQHLDANTAISADLAYVRVLPLAMDHAPAGVAFNIYNFKFDDRVVDLFGGQLTGPVIPFPLNNPPSDNQKWILTKPSGSSSAIALLLRTALSATTNAAPASNIAGSLLFGTTASQTFDIKPIADLGVWSVTITGNSALSAQTSGGDQLVLADNVTAPNDGQKWQLVRPSA